MSALRAFQFLTIIGIVTILPMGCSTLHEKLAGEDCSSCQSCCDTPSWAGIYPTVLTPWCCDGGVDEPALAAQVQYQLKGRVHGLLVLGTIGEGEYATMAERERVITVTVGETMGCVPVVAGIHTCDLGIAQLQAAQAKELGAGAVLVKYAGHPEACFEEVLAFYYMLAQQELLPIIYYHYPSQTGLKLTPEEVAQILMIPGVVGIKESTLDLKETKQHIELVRNCDTAFLSGTALNLSQFMEIGGHGAMCPEAAIMPETTVRVFNANDQCCTKGGQATQEQLFVVAPLLRGGTTIEGSARLLVTLTQNHKIKLPMSSDHPQARLKATLNGLGICMQPIVKCQLPDLSWIDKLRVWCAVRKLK